MQFPETVAQEWKAISDADGKAEEVRQRIKRGQRVEQLAEDLRAKNEANALVQQEIDAGQTPTLEMGSLTEYLNNPVNVPTDLIDGVVKADGLTIVIGPSSSGKSTASLQMCHSILTGDDFLGQSVNKIDGSVGIMSYDMSASMVTDWMRHLPGLNTNRVHVVDAYKRGNPLGVPDFRRQIVEAWKKINVEVVVIDSFSASFFGHDQNDAAQTMAHYRDLKLFGLTEVGAKAMIVIAHSSGVAGKARGSSVHHDVADSIMSIEKRSDLSDQREFSMVKYRAALGQEMMHPVIVTEPDKSTHLVDIDPGAMTLANLTLPPSFAAQAFVTPTLNEAPDTDIDSEEE